MKGTNHFLFPLLGTFLAGFFFLGCHQVRSTPLIPPARTTPAPAVTKTQPKPTVRTVAHAQNVDNTALRVDCSLIDRYIRILARQPLRRTHWRELEDKDGLTISLIRNGLYARKGYRFRTSLYAYFFSQIPWYKPGVRSGVNLDEILKRNAQRLRKLEQKKAFFSRLARERLRAICRYQKAQSTASTHLPRKLPKRLVRLARRYLGYRYCRGGRDPRRGCFDCSGFVRFLFSRVGYRLPHGARKQFLYGRWVSRSKLRVGDLVFFSTRRSRYSISHVGIYAGKGKFIHAENRKKGVRVTLMSHVWYRKHYVGARRISS